MDSWERTLPTEISLIFGRYLQAKEIAVTNFPKHYFNFAAYNELSDRLAAKNSILTDYIGRIRSVGRIVITENATAMRKSRRAIDIENLSGNTIGFTLWDEMALNFNVSKYDSMEKLVIIAVSSCYINRYNGLQLSVTSSTHYYFNPKATLTNTSLGNPDVPEPPKPHTLPAIISQPTIIETSITTFELEPIIKEGIATLKKFSNGMSSGVSGHITVDRFDVKVGKCIIYPTNVHGVPMEPGYMKIQVDTVYPGWEGLKVPKLT
nr:hypothetical protein [Tanacetum cinerariifolium]